MKRKKNLNAMLSLYFPTIVSEELLKMHKEIVKQSDEPERRNAAAQIIQAYLFHYGGDGYREDMWVLLSAALDNPRFHRLDNADARHEMLLFYEFTLMVLDAIYVLHGQERFGKMG